MNCNLLRFALVALSLLLIPAFAKAQVNGQGPSDPALFDTAINLPPDPNIGNFESMGGVTGQTNQLNVMDGGSVGRRFDAFSGSEVNISGGSVGSSFDANSGSEVNISGGTVGIGFAAFSGSVVNISGGSVGRNFDALSGSDVELFGGEFNLNGATFTGLTITLSGGDVFTGTLLDGSAFIFTSDGFFSDTLIGVTLTPTALPTLDTTPIVVNTAFPTRPSGLRAGQTLTLQDGGQLSNFEAVDATLNIEGGSLGERAGAVQSEVNISGGSVGSSFDAFSGSVVNISGGTVGSSFRAFSGSEVNVSGGSVGSSFDANSGSEVNISGGNVGRNFRAISGSVVNISGGSVNRYFTAFSGSDVELFGGEFNLNGATFTGSTITLSGDDVFTGTLTDGSAFIFSTNSNDTLIGVTLTPTALPTLDTTPIVVNTAFPTRPSGLRAGQTLTLQDGGQLSNFEAVDATLNIEGGSLDALASVVQSEVNISGGSVGSSFDAFSGSVVNISGGNVGRDFDAFSGSEVNISGGNVGALFSAKSGSEVNISGGSVNRYFTAFSGSEVNISGGNVGTRFRAKSGSEVNLLGTEFLLDGVLLDSLVTGEAFTITERDVTLSGLLADGTPFDFDLNGTNTPGEDSFEPGSTLTVTLVPEPSSLLLGALASVGLLMRRRGLSQVGIVSCHRSANQRI